ncbi:MAG: DegT/DnrJ/EryC1/StrS aminotransferase family protein [Chitinophagia bacterium]|nr:DegT/DnrJ/EryC1/StrS aminotransferase family protein [Chitinophagia bacterium]
MNSNPYDVVEQFEKEIASFAGAKYGVAVDSCTNALFLSLMYLKQQPCTITIPKRTYISVPSSIIHAGYKVDFEELEWTGVYQLKPLPVYDGAVRFKRNMYKGGYHCLSFHIKKHLKIGRGGMILTDDAAAVEWFRLARFNGRNPVNHTHDTFKMLGWNFYMTNSDAARGLWLFSTLVGEQDDITTNNYPDLSLYNFDNCKGGDSISLR